MQLNFKIRILAASLCLLFSFPAFSREQRDTINYFIESGAVVSSGKSTPFWLISNNYGTIASNSPNIWARAGVSGRTGINKTFSLVYGADIIDRYSGKNEFILQQGYAGIGIGQFTLKAGRYEEEFGNQDQNLSSGGMIWSGNTRPIPQISFATSGYIPVPLTKDFVEFKGGISHGWFEDNQYNSDVWLHHKYMYLRFGGHRRVHIEYGLQHFAQWGGKSSNPEYGELPDNLNAFIKVFLGQGGGDDGPAPETLNVIGNHIGSHNLALDFKVNSLSMKFYWQTIFEDGSGLSLRNIKDGLWGFKISPESWKYISGLLIEYVNSTDQSGRFHDHYVDGVSVIVGGNDDYFNHGIYREGWTYNRMTIGTPLISSPALVTSSTGEYLINNRITAFHFGMEGGIKNVEYKALYTFSKNYGTNFYPFPGKKCQHSVLFKSTINNLFPGNTSLSAAIAFDAGNLYSNNIGLFISLRKNILSGK